VGRDCGFQKEAESQILKRRFSAPLILRLLRFGFLDILFAISRQAAGRDRCESMSAQKVATAKVGARSEYFFGVCEKLLTRWIF
jgi:hypothetical protein